MTARTQALLGWLIAPAMLLFIIACNPLAKTTYFMGDFRAFYCAGAAIDARANPYLEEPLRSCEVTAGPPAEPAFLHGVAVPAPLPPAALLPFAALATLPFAAAATLYGVLSIAAMSLATLLFARLIGVSSLLVNLTFAAVSAAVTYYIGQPTPFVLLALAAAATLLRRERWRGASACAACAMIEPHVALPALLAMFALLPKTRLPLVLGGAGFALAGVVGLGAAATVAYVRDVVPAHALANAYEWQFSLTSLLTSFNVDAPAAVRAGELMFAAMTALGIAVAARLRALSTDLALVVLVPPAFGMFGGVHVHVQQMAVAFPALLYASVRWSEVRRLAATGLALAMIPWNVVSSSPITGASPLLVGVFAAQTLSRRSGVLFAAAAAAIAVSVLAFALAGLGPAHVDFVPGHYAPDALAELSWGDFSRAALMRSSLMMQWLRVPTVVGLACGLWALVRVAFAREAAALSSGRTRLTAAAP